MQVIEMVPRPTLPTTERTKASANQSARVSEQNSLPSAGHRECVSHRPIILDAFDNKVILEYLDRIACPL